MSRLLGSCNIRAFVADDHRAQPNVVEVDRQGEGERVVVAARVHRMHATGNLEGEVVVERRRQLVDAVDFDAEGECSPVLVSGHVGVGSRTAGGGYQR